VKTLACEKEITLKKKFWQHTKYQKKINSFTILKLK
jgi:hypothetical protein